MFVVLVSSQAGDEDTDRKNIKMFVFQGVGKIMAFTGSVIRGLDLHFHPN
jgi:hypothetical protein